MSDRLKALREKRGKIIKEMRDILEKAEAEKRSPTTEELEKHGMLYDEQNKMRIEIEAAERQQELSRTEAAAAEAAERQRREAAGAGGGNGTGTPEERAMAGFRNYLAHGGFIGDGADELRALQADADTQGGFIVAPEQFVNQLIKFVDDQVFIRGLATVIPVASADSLGVPSLDTDPADADWTSEIATGSEDSAMAFGKRSLHPQPLAKRIKVANKLIQRSVLPIESLVIDRLGYKFGITQEKAFLTGSGANQPLGVFTASADGIPTSRDVATGNSTTSITFDGLKEAKFTLKGQYWPGAWWIFHRDAVKQISKLKDGEGRYLWQASVIAGEPDRILNVPYAMSENAPNTFTTGLYVGIIGDFSNYWIADAMAMQMQRLVELYAETNQVGFIGRQEVDGMPVLAEAFVRVTLG